MHRRSAQSGIAERLLAEGAIVLQPLTDGASADHAESLAAQVLLLGAELRLLEDDQPVASDPAELLPPVLGPLDDGGHHPMALGVGDEDADLVPARDQAPIEIAEVVGLADSKDSHTTTNTRSKRCTLREAPGTMRAPTSRGPHANRRCRALLFPPLLQIRSRC